MPENQEGAEEKIYFASQWTLIIRKLRRHKLANVSIVILAVFYLQVILGQFIAPYSLKDYNSTYINASPSKVRWISPDKRFMPHIYGLKTVRDPETLRKLFREDPTQIYPVKFFVKGWEYKFLGLFKTDRHLYGIETNSESAKDAKEGKIFLFGSDSMGRDIFSRIILGSQISLTIPLLGILIGFLLGIILGSISGYFGGLWDAIIQRIIDVIRSFPTLPLWMALSAAIPPKVPIVRLYIYIVIILSLISWTGLARVVRSKFISLKNEEYIMAAKLSGVSNMMIIIKHMIPGFFNYLIVSMTLAIPGMIIGETSMSFLGLGIRSPATSWGVLLQEARQVENIALYPWKLIPLIYVITSVLAFNFFGDGLRDAADPYK